MRSSIVRVNRVSIVRLHSHSMPETLHRRAIERNRRNNEEIVFSIDDHLQKRIIVVSIPMSNNFRIHPRVFESYRNFVTNDSKRRETREWREEWEKLCG